MFFIWNIACVYRVIKHIVSMKILEFASVKDFGGMSVTAPKFTFPILFSQKISFFPHIWNSFPEQPVYMDNEVIKTKTIWRQKAYSF